MYPHERSLVQRLADKPFALVGVNSDKNKTKLKTDMKKEQITWRSWFDGGSTKGPIAKKYQIKSWPTIFLLDGKGIIRYKFPGAPPAAMLDKAIDGLLEEMEGSPVSDAGPGKAPANDRFAVAPKARK